MRSSSRDRGGSWSLGKLCTAALAMIPGALAVIELDLGSTDSIKNAAQLVAWDLMRDYPGNKTGGIPGLWGDPHYWWEAGAAMGSMIDYWYYTGDEGYVPTVMEALIHQVGPENNYMPPNQSRSLGNDDQGFWGLAVMAAAEKKFPDPPEDKPQWLALAQGVFNSQTLRWEEATCNGGLRWQIFTFNNGYDYKNTISNGVFFQLGARLARYTKNDTYAQWAEKTYDWTKGVGFISDSYSFFDGGDVNPNPARGNKGNCTRINPLRWTYNAGMYLAGAAYMYNYTEGSDKWKERVDGILDGIEYFFRKGEGDGPKDVMVELACEPYTKCNNDQRSFKAYLSRFMTLTVKMAPYTHDRILTKLAASARSAVKTCTGGPRGTACSLRWETETFDGLTGLGESMCALEVIQSNLIDTVDPPADKDTGTSKGDPGAGMGGDKAVSLNLSPTTTGDRVGAGILTTLVLLTLLGGAWWMVV